jgi:hypothetical protein
MITITPDVALCLDQAAQLQDVPVQVIITFLKTEGGDIGVSSRNSDGSHDLGAMQINDSTWLPLLSQLNFNGDKALTRKELLYNPCYNINVGTWIFRQYLNSAHNNYSEAIGWYNSHNTYYSDRYKERFASNFLELFGKYIQNK